MKTKPDRKKETPREQVINEALKTDSDDIVTMTFKVPRELQQGYKRRAILPHETLGTPVAKYSFTYGANWISPSTPCVRFNFAQKPL
ncbi:hypothetical protein, partial [methanotrophic endosymbiont of Bathymodiolus puteoserpentis (Logatchev)]|uniref:hypothetical protein n=1 Tax=methanotrophic endosymbiont of Bathymodiolus puteoserpentis (Logatchev) TaxID=343235 RepID=UPI001C2D80CF